VVVSSILVALVHPVDSASLAALARWAEPWRHAFNTSVVVSTSALFAHVTSFVCAGGLSFAADRASLLRSRSEAEELFDAHTRANHRRLATRALIAVVATGIVLFLSDVETFVGLRTFLLKVGLVVMLLVNSALAKRCDDRLCDHAAPSAKGTSHHRLHARVSIVLWLLTLLCGTALLAG